MKYILAENYVLRGYDRGRNNVLTDMETGLRFPLSDSMLFFLQLCDGKTDDLLFSGFPGIKNAAETALKKGWIRTPKENEELPAFQTFSEVATPEMLRVQWSVTGKCNAACRHCFITDHQHTREDLSTEEMIRVLQKLADASIYRIHLTGGEPLVRKDLPVLLKTMKDLHMKVTAISTNGFLLNDEMFSLFFRNGMRPEVQISFDGTGHHDWMRRVPGAEKMAIAAMESCKRNEIPFSVSMCVHRENRDLIVPTAKLVAEKGAVMFRICPTEKIGGFTAEKGITCLTTDEMNGIFMDLLPVLLEEKTDMLYDLIGFIRINPARPGEYEIKPFRYSCTDPEKNRVCTSIDHSMYLSSNGKVLPCFIAAGTFLEEKCLKLTEHSLEECLNSEAYRQFSRVTASELVKRNPGCADCPYLAYCGCGCRGASAAAENHMFGIDRKKCDFFLHGWGEKLKAYMEKRVGR